MNAPIGLAIGFAVGLYVGFKLWRQSYVLVKK